VNTLTPDSTNAGTTTNATVSPLAGHVTRQQLAQLTGKSQRFWLRLELARTGPPVVRLGNTPLYRIDAVRAWLEAKERPAKSRYRSKR
jgi:hypothetical protein